MMRFGREDGLDGEGGGGVKMRRNGVRTVRIMQREYAVTEDMYRVMKYFEESQAICQTDTHSITCISVQIWELVLEILESLNFIPRSPPPKISNNNPRDYLEESLIARFDRTSLATMNRLYQACHFLKIYELKKSIAVYFACKIWFKYNKKGYEAKKEELGVVNDLSHDKMASYLERFPFIN